MEIVENMVQCLVHGDRDAALCIDPLADVIAKLKKEIRANHNRRLEKGKCSVELGMLLIDMLGSLERIAKHCSNIAGEEIAEETESYAMHQLARDRREDNPEYRGLLEDYRAKYALKNL